MKYILIIALSFVIATPVLAAKSVDGVLPDSKPLQPAPSGVNLDYQNSLNSPPPTDFSSEDDNTSSSNLSGSGQNANGGSKQVGREPVPAVMGSFKDWKNIIFVVLVILATAAGAKYWRREK